MKKVANGLVFSTLLVTGFFGVQTSTNAAAATDTPAATATSIETYNLVSPYAIFAPDRCIYPKAVQKFGSGWYVTLAGGTELFLDNAAKHGLRNPSVGAEIEIMVAANNSSKVVGWRVTGN